MKMLGTLVRNICFGNAKNYFGLKPAKSSHLPPFGEVNETSE